MTLFAYINFYAKRLVSGHLLCNLSRKVLVLLLHAFAGLETNELLDGDVGAVLLCNLSYILGYGLLAILSLYIYLV